MEKIRLLKVILFAVIMAFASIDVFAQEPVTIFYESMGTTASSTAPASYTGYDNYGVENIAFSGNADLRTNTASSGYTGASGGSNVFITNVVDRYFLIEGINTLGYEDITLSFGHYKSGTASSNELKIEISDNGIQYTELTYTRPTGSGTATWVLLTFTEDIPATENLRIRFTQTVSTSNYQFRIDDIKLTGTLNTTNPDISITSPENNSVVNSDEVEVNFTLRNFTIDGDTPDGKVAYKLGTDGTVLYTTASPVTISGLALGENTIYFELVDNSESPLLEPVTAELTVIYEIPVPEITITSPEEGSVIYSQDLEVEFIVEDFIIGESEGKVKYTVDEGTPLYTTGSGISLNGLSYGEHTVVLELVNNDESSLDPAVSTSVTFTCEEMTAKIYELVTSMDALSDGGKYLFVGEKDASYYALGWQKTSNRHAVPVTISDNTITAAPAIEVTETQDNVNPYEITLEETTNGFAFYDALNEKYLVPRTGSNNGMLLSATQEDWTVSVGTGSIVSAVANNSTTYPRGTMQFNQSPGIDPLFSCYASASQTGFYLYKAQETNDPGILITSPENNSVVNSDEVEVSFSVRNFTIGGDTPDGKVAYKLGSDGIISYTTTSPVTISGLALGENTIYFELVDNSESSLPEPVTAELTVIYEVPVAELTITSPADDTELNESEATINFTVENILIDGDTPEAKVVYSLNGSSYSETVVSTESEGYSVIITGLSEGSNEIVLALAEPGDGPVILMDPVVSDTITVIYEILVPELTITSPEEGSVIYSQDVEIEFTVDNFTIGESEGKVKYTVDEGTPLYTTGSGISLSGLSYGGHTVVLELVNNDESSLDPSVSTSITFTCTETPSGGMETFNNLNLSGSSYVSGTFLGQDGSTWTYEKCRGDYEITGNAIMIGRNQTPVSYFESGTISGGLRILNFDYMQAFTAAVNLDVYVNDDLVVNVTSNSSSDQNIVKNSGNITVEVEGEFVLKFINRNTSDGQVVVDNISWTGYNATDPDISITSPENNSVVNSDEVEVSFSVRNFTIGGDTPDGKVAYKLGSDGTVLYTTASPVAISGLALGANTIYFELVDNSESSLPEPVTAELTVIYEVPVAELTITSPADGTELNESEATINFTVENILIDGDTPEAKVVYSLNGSSYSETVVSAESEGYSVIITGLSEGSNEIVLALAEPGDGPVILMDPVVSDTITVIYEILVPELTITSPEEGSVIYSQDVEIEFTVDNFTIGESEGKVKYTVDEETPLYITGSNISLSGLSYGEHTVVLELVNNDESSLVPAVTSSVTFTCEERTAKIYELVTSMDALSDGGKYLFVGEKDASYYALGWQKTSNRHAVPVTISNNTITVMPAIEVAETQDNINPYEITLEETTNGFAFYDALNEKYLVPRAGSYNGMLLSATQEDWTVSVGTGSVVSAVANNSTTYPRGTMQFNPNAGNDPLFSCYASATQTGFYLYKAQETGEPYFRITSPSEGAIVGTNQVSVEFIVHNFIMDGDTPDGKVAYKLGTDGAVLYTTSSPVTISGLALGANTIYFELVDNSESPLPEPVTAELTIIYELLMPELTITSPEEGSVIYSQDVEIEFTVENFTIGESDGKVKYTVDEGTASYATGTSISLSGLSYGEHTVMLELVNNDESSLDPVVSTIVTFTCAEAIPTVYALVTSSNELVDGGRYLFVGIKNDAYYALGWQKTSNRHAVPVTVQNNTITVLPAIEVTETQDNINPYEITFEETTNGFAFYDALNEKYLVPRTSSNNGLVLTATEEDWTVTVGADYLVSAVANNSTTYPRGTMQFNPNSGNDPLFSCYASATQTGFYIYKAIETDEPYLGIISPADNTIFRVPDVDIEFQVYNFDLGTEGKVKYTVDDDVTEYTTTNPVMLTDLGNGSYTVVLELVDLYNASLTPPVTASVTFTVEQVGVDTDFTGIVKIYPNPAKENINIELAEDVDKISIVNVMGQIVMEMVPESKTQSIDLGNFERGVYFIKISKANFVNTYKIIVQ